MSWATHVKIQNIGLADTCSPSEKKWYQIPERTGLKRGPAARLKKHIRSDFFSGWLSIAFFTCLCTIQLVFLASQSVMVDQQPICWAGQPTETSTWFFIKPQKQRSTMFVLRPKNMAGVERGRGQDRAKRLKRADAPLLPYQSRCNSSWEEGVPLTPTRHIPHSRHTNKFTHKYNRKGKHLYQTQVHKTRSYS